MNEFSLRADMLERELLSRHAAGKLATIDARQLEAFRASAGVHPADAAWQIVVDRWKTAAPSKEMVVTELETWPETNLHDLMIREEANQSVREDSALELYRRASKFVRAPEFAPFLAMCIDRELVERRAGHDTSRVLDALWRLNEKAEGNKIALVEVDAAHSEAEAHLRHALANAMEALRTEVNVQGETLHQAITAMRRMVKRNSIMLGSATFLTALALVLHLLHGL